MKWQIFISAMWINLKAELNCIYQTTLHVEVIQFLFIHQQMRKIQAKF